MSGSAPKRLYGVDKILVGSNLNPSRPYVNTLWDRSLLVSENHRRVNKFGPWDGGGPFYQWSRVISHAGQKVVPAFRIVDKGNYTCLGVVGSPLQTPTVKVPPAWSTVKSTLSGLYATGYKKARPGNPVASVAQFVAELRDVPQLPFKRLFTHGLRTPVPLRDIPRLLRDYHRGFKSLGSEYLNVVFGWLPFLSDLRKMFYLYQTLDKRLTQIVRENGKFIRRRATIRDDTSVSQVGPTVYNYPYANVYGAPGEIDSPGSTHYTVTTRTAVKEWFVGSFRYMLFEPDPSQWTSTCKAHLFGAIPTPSLLWELMPYSWLIDWFANVGDVISNASPNAVDNLTMRYSFIMRREQTSTEWRAHVYHGASSTSSRKWPSVDHSFTSVDRIDSKSRSGGGNPFGLDVQLTDLSSAQLAILAALGLSRSSVK